MCLFFSQDQALFFRCRMRDCGAFRAGRKRSALSALRARRLHGFAALGMVRNDHAFTLAMAKIQNYGPVDHAIIPWDIITANQNIEVKKISNNEIVLEDQHGEFTVNQSIHILNKESLLNAIK